MNSDSQSGVQPLFIILVDISGYTSFIRLHKTSLLHAEKIIGELMESILKEVEAPIVSHEILGDAISLYALDDGSPGLANTIYQQLEKYFHAFRARESYLLRECGYCACDACGNVGKLKLKAILHSGKAAFTKVRDMQKISGIDIIIAHRLLKNSIPSDEYILITSSFSDKCQPFDDTDFVKHTEKYDDVGIVHGHVKTFGRVEKLPKDVPHWEKLKFFLKIEGYMIGRIFGKKTKLQFKNLPT